MYRAISLLVALAHLGVVAVPCFEMGSTLAEAVARIADQEQQAHHGHHGHVGDMAHEEKAPRYTMRAPCLCGCSNEGASPATSSSRIGFALFPPKPAKHSGGALPILPPLHQQVPDPPLRAFDHIPDFS